MAIELDSGSSFQKKKKYFWRILWTCRQRTSLNRKICLRLNYSFDTFNLFIIIYRLGNCGINFFYNYFILTEIVIYLNCNRRQGKLCFKNLHMRIGNNQNVWIRKSNTASQPKQHQFKHNNATDKWWDVEIAWKALKLLEMAERPAIAEEHHNRNATEHFAYDLVLSQTDDRV